MSDPTADDIVARARRELAALGPSHAERLCREALRLDPRHAAALGLLGYALHASARYDEAEKAYLELAAIEPANAMHWMNTGTARRCAGQLDQALYAFARAAALGAQSADFFYNVALAHIDRDDYESAWAVLERALALAPEDAEIRYRYAFCCFMTMRTDAALAALEGWDSGALTASPEVTAAVGHLLMKLGQPARGEPAVRHAAAAADPRARLTLIQLLERTNQLAEARRLLDVLATDSASIALGADLLLAQAQLAQRESNHALAAELFAKVLADCKELHDEHFQLYPLAKSLDALGRYDEAFAALQRAHLSQTAHLKLTAPLAMFRGAPTLAIADLVCDPADIALWDTAGAPDREASPIFIVAFPRSGTTLLETCLDAHPALKTMDEQPFLQNALEELASEGVRYPAELGRLTSAQLEHAREKYWERVRRKLTLAPGQRLIDKNPLNLLRLPAIKRLFPRAKIILAVRHPCDVLLSCYMQHFRAPDFALLCSDLTTLAEGYRRAFDFWYSQQALLAAEVLEVEYESFVENFEPGMRRILAFLELPWRDAVLRPKEQANERRFISTPSYSQVVQPVSSRAVGRWINYRPHFAQALPRLRSYLERWNYPA